MGPGQKCLTRVRSLFCCLGWVGSAHLKIPTISIFPFWSKNIWVKDGSDSYLLWFKSMLGLGQEGSDTLISSNPDHLLPMLKLQQPNCNFKNGSYGLAQPRSNQSKILKLRSWLLNQLMVLSDLGLSNHIESPPSWCYHPPIGIWRSDFLQSGPSSSSVEARTA